MIKHAADIRPSTRHEKESIDESHPLIPPHRHHPISIASMLHHLPFIFFREEGSSLVFFLRHFSFSILPSFPLSPFRKKKKKSMRSFFFIPSAHIFQ
jgi:hypothetical protein